MINYLLDPFIQIENKNGQPVVGAKIYVYYTGSRTLAPIYSNKSGTSLANPAITDTLGNVTIFAKTGSFYDVLVYDNDGTLLFSKINVTPSDSTTANVREVDIVAGFGIQVHKRYKGNKAIYNVAIDPDEAATAEEVAAKQDKLTPGANIEITNDNTINVVNRKTLYTQWPIKMDRSTSMLKLYLDQDFVGNTTEILPGADLTASYDEFGNKIIGVDTNSSATGDYNFYAGYDNEISGNYSTVFGRGNTVSGDYNTIIGKYANQGDYLFAVGNGSNNTHRSNAFEVRNNGDIYYKYQSETLQLKPANFANYRTSISKEYTIVSNNENINVVMSDEFAPVKTWLNSNYRKMAGPLFFNLKIQFDSQVQTAGMILLDFGYGVSYGTDPVVTNPSKYVYVTKYWTGLSDATTVGFIDAKSMTNSTSLVCNIRNIENNTKWSAGQKVTVTIDFYTRYDNR